MEGREGSGGVVGDGTACVGDAGGWGGWGCGDMSGGGAGAYADCSVAEAARAQPGTAGATALGRLTRALEELTRKVDGLARGSGA